MAEGRGGTTSETLIEVPQGTGKNTCVTALVLNDTATPPATRGHTQSADRRPDAQDEVDFDNLWAFIFGPFRPVGVNVGAAEAHLEPM